MFTTPLHSWGIRTDRILTGPQRLEVEINTACNLTCLFCWFHSPYSRTKMQKWEMPFPVFKKLIDDASALGVQNVYVTGRGEPCLHPSLPRMLAYAKKKGLSVTLTTNLTVLTPKILRAVSLIDKVEVTFCGFPEGSYKVMQAPRAGKGHFSRVVKHLSLLRALRASRGNPKIKINYILTRKNAAAVGPMVRFCRGLGIDEIRLSPFSFIEANKELRLTPSQMARVQREFAVTQQGKPRIDTSWFSLPKVKIRGCYMGWIAALAGVKGRVKIGCFDSPFPDDGNLMKSSFKEIWQSPKTHANRQRLKYGLSKLAFCPFNSPALKRKGIFCPFSLENEAIERSMQPAPGRRNGGARLPR